MQKCTIYHTGVYNSDKGVIKDNKVYFQAQDNQLYFPEEIFLAREECEGGLIQFEVHGKWGLIDNENKTIIPFQWDYLETNYGHHLIFCGRKEGCDLYVGEKDKLLGAITNMQPKPTCNYTIKWGVYDENFNLIVQPNLDEKPMKPMIKSSARSKNFTFYEKYFVLKKGEKYGVLCNDGRWIANIELSKDQAAAMINNISGRYHRDLYLD